MIALLLLLTLICGCAGLEPGVYPNHWSQCVKLEVIGISAMAPYGPVVLGYAKWERNITCSEIPSPQKE